MFTNRADAGRRLAARLKAYRGAQPVVLGLARGGVPVAYEVAQALAAPLDVLVVRKLGAPGEPELAIGAVAPGATFLNHELIEMLRVPAAFVDQAIERESRELAARTEQYRADRPAPHLLDRTVILVDDGIATGATTLAAILAVREQGAARIVVATPACPADTVATLREHADEVVCVATPEFFGAVGFWYQDFSPTSDDEIRSLLKRARAAHKPASPSEPEPL